MPEFVNDLVFTNTYGFKTSILGTKQFWEIHERNISKNKVLLLDNLCFFRLGTASVSFTKLHDFFSKFKSRHFRGDWRPEFSSVNSRLRVVFFRGSLYYLSPESELEEAARMRKLKVQLQGFSKMNYYYYYSIIF